MRTTSAPGWDDRLMFVNGGNDFGFQNACPAASVPCREKIAAAVAAANSRPSFESPAWKITGRPPSARSEELTNAMINHDES